MAELIQLDQAASIVGKSEVTLRRLVKAGKIPFERQKTLTGFIYLVDPLEVKKYYKIRNGGAYTPEGDGADEITLNTPRSANKVRLAVSDETGNQTEYWQKKAESYEDKYYTELNTHAQTREDLGVWRGRAEHAQAMLLKLLPAPSEVVLESSVEGGGSVTHTPRSSHNKNVDEGSGAHWVVIVLGVVLIVAIIVLAYLYFLK